LTQVIATKQKKLLPKPIVTPHIVTTANKNNIVAIQRNYHKYNPITRIFYRDNIPFF
jgi:hypothetical protein